MIGDYIFGADIKR